VLLADNEPPIRRAGHPVGDVRVGARDRDVAGGEVKALDVDKGALAAGLGQRREVESVLAGDVDGALVGVRPGHTDRLTLGRDAHIG
jgi:hypothetical protein